MSKLQKQSVINKKKIIILINYRYEYDTFLHKIFQCLPIGLGKNKNKTISSGGYEGPRVPVLALLRSRHFPVFVLRSSLELLPVLNTVHGHLSSGPPLADSPLFFAWLAPRHPSVLSSISIMT